MYQFGSNYFTKRHPASHNKKVRPIYLYVKWKSTSTLKGCDEILLSKPARGYDTRDEQLQKPVHESGAGRCKTKPEFKYSKLYDSGLGQSNGNRNTNDNDNTSSKMQYGRAKHNCISLTRKFTQNSIGKVTVLPEIYTKWIKSLANRTLP